jgi:peptide/nickel transport system ATP-binding protein
MTQRNSRPVLSVRDLKTYFFLEAGTVKAVDGASFDVHSGRTLALVGESGCGKSVTARSILRLVDSPGRTVQGSIVLRAALADSPEREIDLAKLDPDGQTISSIRGKEIGLVFQEPMTSFSMHYTVGNQMIETIRLHRACSAADATERALAMLAMVEIPSPERRILEYPFELSGGLRQRVMIAMALSCSPRVLIADEPTSALDVTTQAQILRLLRRLCDQTSMASILITHDMGVVAEMADEVAVMYLGRIVEVAPVERLFHDPAHPYTRSLLRSIPNVMSAPRTRLPTIRGSVPHPYDRPTGCPFHPRCPLVTSECDTDEPQLLPVADDHSVSCFLHHPPSQQERSP